MAGVPVHVITTNDYLATRDAQLMRPLYEALGLSVGVISEGMDFDARRAAYACDITYCTNKQVTFDYLRDRVERGSAAGKLQLDLARLYDDPSRCKRLMLRGLCFAIVDEADSVLIDEARTPLILSREIEGDESTQAGFTQALDLAAQLNADEDYRLLARERRVQLTERGRTRLGELAEQMGDLWAARRRREELIGQALSALHLFIRDRHYVVRDGKVQIVDANTGRVMADRSWEHGLHQMVEAKEGCELSGHKETLARISYQRFFRRYLKLSGMTGTALEVERELGEVYGLHVVRIPTHRPPRRVAWRERIYANAKDSNAAVVASAREQRAHGRAVLIGTRSVLMSEHLGQMLAAAGLDPQILNARQDEDEARIVACAGEAGRITVATNMAGRGTDIHLAAGVEDNGGLHVIVTERNEAARIDRQLIGRCARQGDAGSYQMFASLEDEIPALYYPPALRRLLALFARGADRQLPAWLGKALLERAQRSLERRHERARRHLEREDQRLNDMLAFSGPPE
jgi:preprotein translocase subunit SecA